MRIGQSLGGELGNSLADEEDAILAEMRAAVESQKIGREPAGWVTDGRQLRMIIPLDIPALTIGTANLALRAVRAAPDRDISATLVVTYKGRDFHAWRYDWLPPHPHVNLRGPPHLRGLTVETGIHDFAENAVLGLRRMHAENLPICVPVPYVPHDFDAFVREVCNILWIVPTEQVLPPPWSPTFI